MVVALKIDANVAQAVRALDRFDSQVSQPATANALNRTINKLRTESIKYSAKIMGVKRAQFDRKGSYTWRGTDKVGGFNVTRARARRKMNASMLAVGKPHNLIRFGAVNLGSRGRRGVFHHAWGQPQTNRDLIVVTGAGSPFVVAVDPKKKGSGRIGRKAYGPGLASILSEPKHSKWVDETASKWFATFWPISANHQLQRRGYKARF